MSVRLRSLLIIVLCFSLAPLRAQTQQPVSPKHKVQAPAPKATNKPADKDKDDKDDDDDDVTDSAIGIKTQDVAKPTSPAAKQPETKISPQEAEELFKSVDELMQFASKDTGLPIKSSVKRELATREQVQKYVEERLAEDEDQKRFERTELVLKKFGLLPQKFELRPFMLTLLREQIAGFYDAKRKTVHLLDWIPLDTQRPVMAHELTHALQDQTIDLEKWMNDARDAAKKSADRDNAEIELDELVTARTALVEGQGMAVLVDYILAPSGRTLQDSPQIVEALKQGMESGEGSTVLNSAPLLLRESLTFPYKEGLTFVQALLNAGGKERAYAAALADPPRDTHEILTPKDYLDKKSMPKMLMPDVKRVLGKNYEHYDVGSVGQFDVAIMLREFADIKTSRELSPEWRGGMYYSGFIKSGKKTAPTTTEDLALLYVSRWSSPAAAQRFADVYALSVPKRYANAAPKTCTLGPKCSTWNTVEKSVINVETVNHMVIITESFDEKTAAKLRRLVLASDANHVGAEVKTGNLGMRVAAPIFAIQHSIFH
ncbi:MAG: hypothetical protein JWO13_1182 [Acidobacteriales bacterium]|nr:hypothetical protein [Terriglobales bacterium]